jgi:hypothetical protein
MVTGTGNRAPATGWPLADATGQRMIPIKARARRTGATARGAGLCYRLSMPSLPAIVWAIFVLAAILVIIRIWARRVEEQGKRIEEHERIPRSLDGHPSRRSTPEGESSPTPRGKDA